MFLLFSIQLGETTVIQALRKLMPNVSIQLYDEVIAQDIAEWPQMAIHVIPNKSNFPMWVDFCCLAPEEIFIELARRLSVQFKCSTVCEPGKFKPKGCESSPYWAIVWKEGQAFLGDDVEWQGESGGKINVYDPIEVPATDLNALIKEWLSAFDLEASHRTNATPNKE